MSMDTDNIHLLPIGEYDNSDGSSPESDDEDSIEIVSEADEEENHIIDMTKNLAFSSDDELETYTAADEYLSGDINNRGLELGANDNIRSPFKNINNYAYTRDVADNVRPSLNDISGRGYTLSTANHVRSSFEKDYSKSNIDLPDNGLCEYNTLDLPASSASSCLSSTTTNGNANVRELKRKRYSWSIEQKLEAISIYKLNKNKRKTANECGCTAAQLRKWLVNEDKLISLSKEKKGKKRRRVGGGGKKLKFVELDLLLLAWYRERRTKIDPNTTIPPENIRRDKVTFKQLLRQGKRISTDLKHEVPSCKWFYRFLKRNNLSLQKPKRQQKIPLPDAYRLVSSFYSYLRRASTWGPKRGPMGAFTPYDVCNMDESPIALFGDQAKRSINDINTPNDIDGNLGDKRFATLILTVFAQDNSRVGPILIFKGKGHVSSVEKSQYAQGVTVLFTPKGVINGILMNQYVKHWWSKVKDPHPKLLIVDSANSHLHSDIIDDLRKKRVVVAVVPKGCTMYVQVLDVSFFSVFKNHYDDVVDEYIEKFGARNKIKLTASQSRILCTRFTWAAWVRTLNSIDVMKAFHDIGYIWKDDSPVPLRSMPGYSFDPTSADYLSLSNDDYDTEDRIDIVAEEVSEKQQQQQQQSAPIASTQLKITNMWKKNN